MRSFSQLLGNHFYQVDKHNHSLQLALASCLPLELRNHVTIATLNDGILTLVTNSPARSARLRYSLDNIKQGLSGISNVGEIREIYIKVSPETGQSIQRRQSQRKKAKLSSTAATVLEDLAHCCNNDALSDALKRLAKRQKR